MLHARVMLDYVDAELDVSGNDHLPRIPPLRYGLGLEGTFGVLTASVDYTHVTEQDDVAENELVTARHEDLRIYVGAEFGFGDSSVSVFAEGRNLTDDEQRHHTSFIKDFAPAPGRTVEAGVRLVF